MGGPIVRSGASPEFSENWDRIFGDKKKEATPAKKAAKKKAAKGAAKKAAKKTPAQSAKKKTAKKKAAKSKK